jgi:hypothetical protein
VAYELLDHPIIRSKNKSFFTSETNDEKVEAIPVVEERKHGFHEHNVCREVIQSKNDTD